MDLFGGSLDAEYYDRGGSVPHCGDATEIQTELLLDLIDNKTGRLFSIKLGSFFDTDLFGKSFGVTYYTLSREGKFRTELCEATNIQTDLLLDWIVFFIMFLLD